MKQPQTNRWPLVLFSIPFAAVLFGIVMISTVIFFPDDLVVDQYYKDGMAINKRIEADQKASELGITVHIEQSGDEPFRILVEGATDSAVQLSLRHVTDQRLDQSFTLVPEGGTEYVGANDLAEVLGSTGIWYLELEGLDDGWRVRQRLVTPLASIRLVAHE